MAIQTLSQLKQWFRTGLYPSQSQFADWFDSFRHKTDPIEMASVTGLVEILQNLNSNTGGGGGGGGTPPIILAGTNTCTIPAGTRVDAIIILDTQPANISLGTTNGGAELIDTISCEPPLLEVDWTKYFEVDTNVFFTGMNTTTVIKIYRR